MFQAKVVEKIKTHFVLSNFFFSSENRAIYETTWKNIVERGRPQHDNMTHAQCMYWNRWPTYRLSV